VGRDPFVVQVRSAQQRWMRRRFFGHDGNLPWLSPDPPCFMAINGS
jgi:hypothetical protein